MSHLASPRPFPRPTPTGRLCKIDSQGYRTRLLARHYSEYFANSRPNFHPGRDRHVEDELSRISRAVLRFSRSERNPSIRYLFPNSSWATVKSWGKSIAAKRISCLVVDRRDICTEKREREREERERKRVDEYKSKGVSGRFR